MQLRLPGLVFRHTPTPLQGICHKAYQDMKTNLQDELDRTKRYVRKHFSNALMSDAKWWKLICSLEAEVIGIEQIVVKFIDSADTHTIRMPRIADLSPPKPFIDTLEFGPIETCAIEWIEIPEMTRPYIDGVPASTAKQDIKAARATIASLGKYPVEDSRNGLVIRGYLR
ncbi:hypothetical protein [Roseibium sediminicola]|uniref:Uncharacterized protein n=1 Tax=Roseibium sediminicola TaxID=2933272 RepID=A0ABT0GRU1_9HYPH|nr:hypothetical protein [Roseibium sp. CAU 1639]MCK7611772.1 hypothetical protein [Roseibium sp. CAU 1639]